MIRSKCAHVLKKSFARVFLWIIRLSRWKSSRSAPKLTSRTNHKDTTGIRIGWGCDLLNVLFERVFAGLRLSNMQDLRLKFQSQSRTDFSRSGKVFSPGLQSNLLSASWRISGFVL